jgi:hypothetical protein
MGSNGTLTVSSAKTSGEDIHPCFLLIGRQWFEVLEYVTRATCPHHPACPQGLTTRLP